MKTWNDVNRWRRMERKRLLSERLSIRLSDRNSATSEIASSLKQTFPELAQACIGFYWPFRGEIDLRIVVEHFIDQEATAALPVVVKKGQPLEFWSWQPGMKLDRGVWNIPIPASKKLVQPTALLVPLVGFDPCGFRLGYGGGFFDRTLSAMQTERLTIGIGYEFSRLPTIYPQLHDIPMDFILTEKKLQNFPERISEDLPLEEDPNDAGTYASPPCFMHELEVDQFTETSTEPGKPQRPSGDGIETNIKSSRCKQ